MNEKKEQMYIVRCDRAGVFFGAIKERRGTEATMTLREFLALTKNAYGGDVIRRVLKELEDA